MKKIAMFLSVILCVTMVTMDLTASAQTRADKKNAKKMAKQFEKEGFYSLTYPIEQMYLDYFVEMAKTSVNGQKRYISAQATGFGGDFQVATENALNAVDKQVADEINRTIVSQTKMALGDRINDLEKVVSVNQFVTKTTLTSIARLTGRRIMVNYQRVSPTNSRVAEVRVVVIYDKDELKQNIEEDIREELKKELGISVSDKILDNVDL